VRAIRGVLAVVSGKGILVLCCAALLVGSLAVRAAEARSGSKLSLRIFDPHGRVRARVTLAGIVRSETRTIRIPSDPPGVGRLSVAFTKSGRTSFCSLTRGLAHVGARLQHLQADALEVDGRIYARGYIEYRIFPNGLCVPGSASQIQFSMKLTTARRLTRLIRTG
jgi:hypothetical protein